MEEQVVEKSGEELISAKTKIIIVFFAILIGSFVIQDRAKKRDLAQWRARNQEIAAQSDSGVAKLFGEWRQEKVFEDGKIEIWSGAQSEVLFVQAIENCGSRYTNYPFPCWNVWARTKSTNRFFKLRVNVDLDDDIKGWRWEAGEAYFDVNKKTLVEAAISAGRRDVLRRLGISPNDA